MDLFRNHVLLAIMPVFFLSTGLRTDWGMGGARSSGQRHSSYAAVGGKLAGLHLAGWILKWPKGEAAIIGWLLQTKALIMIIFANILLDREIITGETFAALLLIAVASTMLTIPLVQPKLRRMNAEAAH